MKKQRINIEYELQSSSPNIIWPLLSSAHGLEKWLADSVTREDDTLTFTWGQVWSHHETRRALITEEIKQQRIRLRWEDESDDEAFWQMEIEKSDITNDYILIITDYAEDNDVDSLYDIWDNNLERLHRTTGL
ncbi:MAG: hypothetical protein J5506_03585 [Prevotella sp.]|nr:hypothetical protein [Prevotella sp.]